MIHKKSSLLTALLAVVGVVALGAPTFAVAMDGGRAGMAEQQKQRVEERKAAIQERLETIKEERTARLDAKRLEICEKRQQKINDITARGMEQNKKQLAVFQKIEENVKAFAAEKSLSNNAIDAAITAADTKKTAAVATIEAAAEISFVCSTTDATKPGSIIKEAMTSRHAALKEYRTSIKDLIVTVKQAINGQDAADTVESKPATDATEEQ